MSDLITVYDLAVMYGRLENKEEYYEKVLDEFNQLSREDQLKVVQHYFVEVQHNEYLKLLHEELFNEEKVMLKQERDLKAWLFKSMIIFGLVVIFFFVFILDMLEKLNGSESSLESIFKFLSMMFG